MSDLISRHAAIDAMSDTWKHICYVARRKHPTKGEEAVYRDMCGTINRVPCVQPEQRWIPCNEMLPEYDGEMYLVTDYCEQINRRRIHVSYCYVNREGFWSDVPIGYKVIAWMQLPDPYLGEGRIE